MKQEKILITGASGFIGTNVFEHFYSMGHELLNIDSAKPLNSLHNAHWKKVDIRNFEALSNAIYEFNPTYILHLAARTDLNGENLDDYSANIIGTKNLLEIIGRLKNLKKIIFTSSMLVCGPGYIPINQHDYSPMTIYGRSKVESEKIIWGQKPTCDWAILRPTSIWGPWFGTPYRDFFDAIISHRYFHIGFSACTKTYGYVGNSIYQIQQILFNVTDDENKKVFYIGDSPATNIEEWGNEIASELGFKIKRAPFFVIKIAALIGDLLKFIGIKFPMTSFRLNNMTRNNIINLNNTHQIAPYPPFTRLEGIKETLKWMKTI